jgi:hypothetical protein
VIVLELPIGEPEFPEPHPELVASKQPSAAEIMHAAQRLGWLPCEPFLRPVVPIRLED